MNPDRQLNEQNGYRKPIKNFGLSNIQWFQNCFEKDGVCHSRKSETSRTRPNQLCTAVTFSGLFDRGGPVACVYSTSPNLEGSAVVPSNIREECEEI
jgi:hypothetical protein